MHKAMLWLARAMAFAGGAVLIVLILLTCVSVAGRVLNGVFHGETLQTLAPGFANWALAAGLGPVTGDFELVEAGMAFAVFSFLPLTQVTGGHATVDIFTARLPGSVLRPLRAAIEVIFAAVLILIAWRLYEGMASKIRYGETSFLLQFPIWWAFAASFFAAVIAALVGVYTAAVRLAEAVQGRTILPRAGEAEP